MKIYKYIKFKKPKITYIFKKTLSLSIVYSKCVKKYEKIRIWKNV